MSDIEENRAHAEFGDNCTDDNYNENCTSPEFRDGHIDDNHKENRMDANCTENCANANCKENQTNAACTENQSKSDYKAKDMMKHKKKLTMKQILAWIAIILLVGMYVLTLIFSLIDSPFAQQLFHASLYCTVFIPVMSWVFIMVTNLVKKQKDDNLINGQENKILAENRENGNAVKKQENGNAAKNQGNSNLAKDEKKQVTDLKRDKK